MGCAARLGGAPSWTRGAAIPFSYVSSRQRSRELTSENGSPRRRVGEWAGHGRARGLRRARAGKLPAAPEAAAQPAPGHGHARRRRHRAARPPFAGAAADRDHGQQHGSTQLRGLHRLSRPRGGQLLRAVRTGQPGGARLELLRSAVRRPGRCCSRRWASSRAARGSRARRSSAPRASRKSPTN